MERLGFTPDLAGRIPEAYELLESEIVNEARRRAKNIVVRLRCFCPGDKKPHSIRITPNVNYHIPEGRLAAIGRIALWLGVNRALAHPNYPVAFTVALTIPVFFSGSYTIRGGIFDIEKVHHRLTVPAAVLAAAIKKGLENGEVSMDDLRRLMENGVMTTRLREYLENVLKKVRNDPMLARSLAAHLRSVRKEEGRYEEVGFDIQSLDPSRAVTALISWLSNTRSADVPGVDAYMRALASMFIKNKEPLVELYKAAYVAASVEDALSMLERKGCRCVFESKSKIAPARIAVEPREISEAILQDAVENYINTYTALAENIYGPVIRSLYELALKAMEWNKTKRRTK